VLRGATGWLIEVVFDAYQHLVAKPSGSKSVDNVVVTFTTRAETADNHIERRFETLRKANFTNMVVCTDDVLLQTVRCS
jgi:predicted RNA-binding protein with PIN domain